MTSRISLIDLQVYTTDQSDCCIYMYMCYYYQDYYMYIYNILSKAMTNEALLTTLTYDEFEHAQLWQHMA